MSPRKKQEYALAEDGNGGLGPVAVERGANRVPAVSSLSSAASCFEEAIEALQWLDARTDGWVRLIPAGEGKNGYAKFKFTSGPHRGKYVMWVGPAGDMIGRIQGLEHKVRMVDAGTIRPALDSYGGDGWESA